VLCLVDLQYGGDVEIGAEGSAMLKRILICMSDIEMECNGCKGRVVGSWFSGLQFDPQAAPLPG